MFVTYGCSGILRLVFDYRFHIIYMQHENVFKSSIQTVQLPLRDSVLKRDNSRNSLVRRGRPMRKSVCISARLLTLKRTWSNDRLANLIWNSAFVVASFVHLTLVKRDEDTHNFSSFSLSKSYFAHRCTKSTITCNNNFSCKKHFLIKVLQKRRGMYKVSVLLFSSRRSCNFFVGRYKLDNWKHDSSKSRVQWRLAREYVLTGKELKMGEFRCTFLQMNSVHHRATAFFSRENRGRVAIVRSSYLPVVDS